MLRVLDSSKEFILSSSLGSFRQQENPCNERLEANKYKSHAYMNCYDWKMLCIRCRSHDEYSGVLVLNLDAPEPEIMCSRC